MDICNNEQLSEQKYNYILGKLQNLDDEKINKIIDLIDYKDDSYVSNWNKSKSVISNMKSTVSSASNLGICAFTSALIIATIITILLIPIVNSFINDKIPNTFYRLFVIWIFLIAIIFIVEMIALKINS